MNLQKIKECIVDNFCCKYSIPYYLLMLLRSKGLHSLYHTKNNLKVVDYVGKIKDFLDSNKNTYIYVCLKGAAGDISLYYLFLKEVLDIKRNFIILSNEKYKDILYLYKKNFQNVDFIVVNDYIFLETETEIRKNLKLNNNYGFLDLRDCNSISNNSFIKYGGNNYEYNKNLGYKLRQEFASVVKRNESYKVDYNYTNVDLTKLKNLEKKFLNRGELIICNFENKSYKLARKDAIKFSEYVKKISEIAKRQNLKFVINSVYNNEKLYNDENILITRLNFQEIIRLAEHNKIKLFISERNGLNDVFKVFYPDINQIIYYPDYYNPCCDKKVYYMLYKETLKNLDVKDFWHLPGDNIIEDIRENFFKTIENYLNKLF